MAAAADRGRRKCHMLRRQQLTVRVGGICPAGGWVGHMRPPMRQGQLQRAAARCRKCRKLSFNKSANFKTLMPWILLSQKLMLRAGAVIHRRSKSSD